MADKWAMKYVLIFFLFITYAFAQTTGTHCCKIVDSQEQNVIPAEKLATSCLLCSNIQLSEFEDLMEVADSHFGPTQFAALELSLKACHQIQNDLMDSIRKVIKDAYSIHKDKSLDSLEKVIINLSLLANSNLSAQIEMINPSELKKYLECGETAPTGQVMLNSYLKKMIVRLKEIKNEHQSTIPSCVSYSTSDKEKKIIELMDNLIKLEEKLGHE